MSHQYDETDNKSEKDIQPVHAIIEADVGLPPSKVEGDAVFGEVDDKGPNYRSMGYIATIFVMIKTNIGLGVLAMPFLFNVIGMVPGILLFGFMGVIFIWINYVIGQFKRAHPEIYAIDDIGYIMAGRWGKEFLAWSLVIYLIVCAGSGMLGLSIGLNAMSTHGACTAVFVVVCAVLVGVLSSIQTMSKLAWLAYVGAASILAAVLTLVIAVGVSNRPSLAPATGEWTKEVIIAAPATFAAVGSTLGGMMYTLAGTPMYFPILSEMKDQSKYGRAAVIAQSIVVIANIIVGSLVYHFCGQYVASPSPGSAGPLMKKVTYGIAFPGMLFSTLIFNHMAAKYIFVRMLRGTRHISSNTARHWATWIGSIVGVTSIAYLVSSGIPIFSSLASLIGAFFGPIVSLLPISLMWIRENYHLRTTSSFSTKFQLGWAAMIFVFGSFILVAGTYGAISDIKAAFDAGLTSKPWGCGDNSNSV